MRRPTPQFTVERRRAPAADATQPQRNTALKPPRPVIAFVECSGYVDVRLGVVSLGAIVANPNSNRSTTAFAWTCRLPGAQSAPEPARDMGAAMSALRHRIADWFDATGDVIRARVLREAR